MKSLKSAKRVFVIFILVIAISACDTGQQSPQYPSLKVVNQYSGKSINSVALVGYDFENLLITSGSSQTFTLDGGMPGGYTGINIIVSYGFPSVSNKFDFSDGKVTTITLYGSDVEGSPYYNNTLLE